jgi:hypothetical protein
MGLLCVPPTSLPRSRHARGAALPRSAGHAMFWLTGTGKNEQQQHDSQQHEEKRHLNSSSRQQHSGQLQRTPSLSMETAQEAVNQQARIQARLPKHGPRAHLQRIGKSMRAGNLQAREFVQKPLPTTWTWALTSMISAASADRQRCRGSAASADRGSVASADRGSVAAVWPPPTKDQGSAASADARKCGFR